MMNPWVILGFVLAVGAAAGAGYLKGESAGQLEVQQKWDKDIARQEKEHAEAVARMREQEQAMQAKADRERQEKDREIRNANARAIALSNSLQQRADRPAEGSSVPGATGTGQTAAGCTGAQLYRPDGEFLVREFRRAEELRLSLKECLARFDK